jgi:hypothetical protein
LDCGKQREKTGDSSITKGIHHLPTSTVCKQTTHRRRFRLSTLTFLLFFSSSISLVFNRKKNKTKQSSKTNDCPDGFTIILAISPLVVE